MYIIYMYMCVRVILVTTKLLNTNPMQMYNILLLVVSHPYSANVINIIKSLLQVFKMIELNQINSRSNCSFFYWENNLYKTYLKSLGCRFPYNVSTKK